MSTAPRLVSAATLWFVCAAKLTAAITVSGVTDKTKYDNSITFTVAADPSATTTTATLDGTPVAVGTAVVVTDKHFHELKAESRDAEGVLVATKTVRFIVRDSSRVGTEDGIPPFTPFRSVDDAPSAFAGGILQVIAPAAWPIDLPIPLATMLRDATGEALWLTGKVTYRGFPTAIVQLRRGWGSTVMPAVATAGTVQVNAMVAGLTANPSITIESTQEFTEWAGTLSTDTLWPAHARIRVSGTLTVAAGATLTVGEGAIIKVSAGNGTAGSAAELVVNGTARINGTAANPVVFTPDTATGHWGGIELPAATSNLTAQFTIFSGAGEDQTWFDTHSGYSTHKKQQALFLISGSGSSTAVGAQLHLTDCYCFDLAGQEMNSKTNTWIDLNRTLMQRAVTCGELNGSKVTIDRSALIEFPSEDAAFVDADNDAIYLTNGDLSISNTVIGFTKDDGVDSGGNGGDNPFTAAADVTPLNFTNNWFEGVFHEGNSLSGTRNVTHTGDVFLNCGQGVEDGYTGSTTGYGPNALIDSCLFAGNMVGARYGDNYDWDYNGVLEVRNSILVANIYHDVWGYDWKSWTYNAASKFNVHDNQLSQPDPVNHPLNTTWNPTTQGTLLEPFMPVPGSAVGVAVSSYAPAQASTAVFPGTFTVRLSTFSSKPVTVNWSVIGTPAAAGEPEVSLSDGLLEFAPGEVYQTINPVVTQPGNYAILRLALTQPVNAEVTGEAWYIKTPDSANPTLVARGSAGWRYRETRSEPPAYWKTLGFDDSSATATEWLPCTLPVGFVGNTPFSPTVTFGTMPGYGTLTDRTKAYYFRKKFTVTDPTQITALTLNIRRDDGAVVWLNNDASATVVSADGTFNPPYAYATLAPNATSTGTYLSYQIPVSKLVSGDNILAVEVHQSSVTSSDLLLDCELLATWQTPLELNLNAVGGQFVLYWLDGTATLEASTDLQQWQPVPGGRSPLPFQPTGAAGFFRLRK